MATYRIDTNPPPQPPKDTRRKWLNSRRLTITASVASLLLIGLVGWSLWAGRAPKPSSDALTIAKFMSTDKFASMSDEQKRPYIDAMRQNMPQMRDLASQLSREERRAAFENLFGNRMQEQVDAYFALPPGPQRTAAIDKVIDEMEQRRSEWAQRAATRPANEQRPPRGEASNGGDGTGERRGGRMDPGRMKDRIENVPPERRAKMSEYIAEIRKRRAERGLPSDGPGRGGRGL